MTRNCLLNDRRSATAPFSVKKKKTRVFLLFVCFLLVWTQPSNCPILPIGMGDTAVLEDVTDTWPFAKQSFSEGIVCCCKRKTGLNAALVSTCYDPSVPLSRRQYVVLGWDVGGDPAERAAKSGRAETVLPRPGQQTGGKLHVGHKISCPRVSNLNPRSYTRLGEMIGPEKLRGSWAHIWDMVTFLNWV